LINIRKIFKLKFVGFFTDTPEVDLPSEIFDGFFSSQGVIKGAIVVQDGVLTKGLVYLDENIGTLKVMSKQGLANYLCDNVKDIPVPFKGFIEVNRFYELLYSRSIVQQIKNRVFYIVQNVKRIIVL